VDFLRRNEFRTTRTVSSVRDRNAHVDLSGLDGRNQIFAKQVLDICNSHLCFAALWWPQRVVTNSLSEQPVDTLRAVWMTARVTVGLVARNFAIASDALDCGRLDLLNCSLLSRCDRLSRRWELLRLRGFWICSVCVALVSPIGS
jgi:hypothetical protein